MAAPAAESAKQQGEQLLQAVGAGDVAAVQTLLRQEGAAAFIDHRDGGGMTPLLWAACEGRTEIAGLLLEQGADPAARNDEG
jgi:ankyrin repeat protein